jgi:signal transduction histidine kinase
VWLIPLVVLAIQLVGSIGPRHRAGHALHWAPLNWFGYLLLVAGPVVLLMRTVYPYAVLLTVLAITVVYTSAGFGYGPIFVSLIIAFLTAAAVGLRWRTYPLPVLGWVAVVWLVPLIRGEDPPPTVVSTGIAAWLLVLLAAAEGIRQRRAVRDARRQRKAAMAREARLEQDRRATQARLSIARELHDVLAHSLSMINVQSSVALELLNDQPERAGPALAAIKDASRQAISDVHSLVTALRADSGQPTAPTPGIADLDGLVATARDGVDRDDGRAGLAATAADGDRRRRGPHRAGVADQCGAALDGRKRRSDSDLRRRRAYRRRRQRRATSECRPLVRRQWHHRDAGAGQGSGRGFVGATASWRRLQCAGHPAHRKRR